MTLSKACKLAFESGDRERGNDPKVLGRVEIREAGHSGVLAIADGSHGEEYLVGLDLVDAADGVLGVHCDCQRYGEGFLCKHLWATLAKLDQDYTGLQVRVRSFDIYDVDPAEISIGKSLTKTRRIASKPKPNSANASAKKSKSGSDWRSALQRIHSVDYRLSDRPSDSNRDAAPDVQHWFVISTNHPDNELSLVVSLMRSQRYADGRWSTPAVVQLDDNDIARLENDAERSALELLTPTMDYRTGFAPNGIPDAAYVFAVEQARLAESVHAMHDTGRLAWKLGDSGQHFEDGRPITQVLMDQPFHLQLNLEKSGDTASKLRLYATISNGQQSFAMEQVIWASEIGCALVNLPSKSTDLSKNDAIQTALIRLPLEEMELFRGWQEAKSVLVPKRSLWQMLRELGDAQSCLPIEFDSSLEIKRRSMEPKAKCLLQQQESMESKYDVSLTAAYEEREVSFHSDRLWWYDETTKTIVDRDLKAEAEFVDSLPVGVIDFTEGNDFYELDVAPQDFIDLVQSLHHAGWEVTANGARIRLASDFDIAINSGMDWFDLHAEVDFDGQKVFLPELLRAMKRGDSTIVLDDGTEGMLPEDWLNRFVDVGNAGEEQGDSLRFQMSQGLMLDLMLQDEHDIKKDAGFKKFLKKVQAFDGIRPAKPPSSFCGELREYQQVGLGWFHFLQEFRFGGCLADDMGLGKTIQVLALLDKRRKRRLPKGQERKPSIVVVPKSLVFNWIDEAKKFTPKLRLMNYTGSGRQTELADAIEQGRVPHLIVTTYGTLRNDVPMLHKHEFDYVILDEAQAIKNPNSQAAKASRLLNGEHRLAMTGTPVENRLGDLWSLFEFLNPGMLDPKSMGCQSCSAANRLPNLEDEESRQRIENLGQSLRPFILRRTKEEVLTELPDKVEQTLHCEMAGKQRKMYDELKTYYRAQLSNTIEEVGLKKAKIHVLEALLRLRQAACDPRLVKPDCKVRGAKINSLLDQLEEVVGEGHKALVFSQFTTLLSLLRKDLDKRKWKYEYLDGKTRRRAARVERFQTDDECPLFLISLKAGGTGLNLTAADYVFILDPWWNPAVEAQAIDRAHRIGQTKSVNAYRMVCTDTVEDKIIELQQTKRNLADAIISQEKSLISDLTADDLQKLLG